MSLLMLALLSGAVFFTFFRGYKLFSLIARTERAKEWELIEATVKDCRILDKQESAERRIRGFKNCFFYATYCYNNVEFGTSTINLYDKPSKSDSIPLKNLKNGQKIEVFVNPNKPHQAILLHPASHGVMKDWFMMMFGLGLSLITLYFMVNPNG